MSYPGPPGVSRPAAPPSSLPPRPAFSSPAITAAAAAAAPATTAATASPTGFPSHRPSPLASSAPGFAPPPTTISAPPTYGPAATSFSSAPVPSTGYTPSPGISSTTSGSYGPTAPGPSHRPSPHTGSSYLSGRGRGGTFNHSSNNSQSSYGAPNSPYGYGPQGGYGRPPPEHQQQHHQHHHQQANYPSAANYSTPGQGRGSYSGPQTSAYGGTPTGSYEPDMAVQIAQWQSAYMPKDPNDPNNLANGDGSAFDNGANAGLRGPGAGAAAAGAVIGPNGEPVLGADGGTGAGTPGAEGEGAAAAAPAAEKKKKTVYRAGGGKKWQDDTLLDWDPAHLRLFVGNLAGETTDESLLKAFARWRSVQKARVVRDKRSTKSRGFGFVSFSDPEDFFQAAKEMNGKYIQSHPVVVHKAKTEIKAQAVREDHRHNRKGGGGKWRNGAGGGNGGGGGGGGGGDGEVGSGNGGGGGGGLSGEKRNGGGKESGSGMGANGSSDAPYEPHLGPMGGGITKPGQKTRGGLKLLG